MRQYIELLRPYIALPPLIAFIIAAKVGNQSLSVVSTLMGSLVLLLIVTAATIYNDIEDRAIDRDNRPPLEQFITFTSVVRAAYVTCVIYTLAAILALLSGNHYAIAFVLIGLILSWAYNSAPLRLSRRPLSSIITLGVSYGSLPILFGGQSVSPLVLGLAAAWFLQRCGISVLKDYKDVIGDAKHRKRTFLLAYGPKATATISLLLGTIGGVAALVLLHSRLAVGPLSANVMTVVLSAGLVGLLIYRSKLLRSDTKQSAKLFGTIFEYQNIYDGILLICLIQS